MKLIRTFIHRPIAVAMCYMVIFFTGLASLSCLPLKLTPSVDFPKLSITTYWRGSSPESVEAFVTSPIEAIASTVTNVQKVNSISEEGQSRVDLEFARGTDMDFATLELNEKLSILKEELPYGVQPPGINKYVPREFQVGVFLSYQLTGPYSLQELRKFALEKLKTPLMGIDGVADVQVIGGQDREIRIELDKEKLMAYGISPTNVSMALSNAEIRTPAGKLLQGRKRFDVLIYNSLKDVEEIEDLLVTGRQGRFIHLRDLARVEDTYAEPRSLSRINGHPTVQINIEKEAGTNTIRVADAVFAKLEQLKENFPARLELIKERDQSEKIRTELANLSSRALFCILIIFLVLLVFLRNLKTPLIILSTIFFSVLLTINFFYIVGIGLNLLTLAGLALGFGMLVDNSIVVLDNIYRYRQQGLENLAACEQSTIAVALPIIAATLTTVAAFIPFLYLTGELRIYYLPFTTAVALSLLSSLLVAFSFTPSLTARFLQRAELAAPVRRSSRKVWFGVKIENGLSLYRKFIQWVLNHKALVILFVLIIMGISFYVFNKYVPRGQIFAWGARDTYLVVRVSMPTGSELERTDAVIKPFEECALRTKYFKQVTTNVYPEYARLVITFPPELEMTAAPLILKEELTQLATQIAGPPVGVYGFGPGFYSGGGGAAPHFRIMVLGYNYNQVKRIAEDLGKKLARYSRVRDVDTNSSRWYWRDDLFEIVLRVNSEKLNPYHLTTAQLLNHVQSHIRENLGWNRIKIQGEEIDYRLKMIGYERFNMEELQNMIIHTPGGEPIRLKDVSEIFARKVMPRIERENQQYKRVVSFEYRGPYKMGDKLVDSIIKNTQLPHGYKLTRETFFFMGEEETRQIYFVMALSLLLVYMVTAALFESLIHPFVVILTIPLALIGVFLIFFFSDTSFDRSAYIGVILLAGIVVNNSIILVDHINRLRRKGQALYQAVVQGCSDRVRPILMTTATTVMGLLPLVLFATAEKSIWYSLALATIGGLLSSTVMVLTVIPVLYVVLDVLKGRRE